MNKLPVGVNNYLTKYQIHGWTVEKNTTDSIKNIIVIPAICEYENIKMLVSDIRSQHPEYLKKTLVIFIVNNTASSKASVREDNLRALTFLRELMNENSHLNLGVIDASSESKELPEKDGGVGLARKIGMDLALTLFDYNDPGKNILICLDADCRIESTYLEVITSSFNQRNISAACIKYQHIIEGPTEQQLAICCYEIFLRYYVLGLKYAQSAYAFHTVGSSMACDHEAYIKSEGMNKLKAAEDFYFLEKLAKNYSIEYINNTIVYPSSRGSWRVPFGTGQRINRFLSHQQDEYLLYNPESFKLLKSWLTIFNSPAILTSGEYLNRADAIHPELRRFLELQKFPDSWNKIIKFNKKEVHINRQKNFWFDGFRTLKLIHHLRDTAFPLINMFDAVDSLLKYLDVRAEYRGLNEAVPSIDVQIRYLNFLRALL